jgi:hypothetical protein
MVVKAFGDDFKPSILVRYPPHADDLLESYFHDWLTRRRVAIPGWTYLDVYWTSLYVNRDQAKRPYDRDRLSRALAALPRGRYFTLVQYVGGIAERLPEATVVFSAGSAKGAPRRGGAPTGTPRPGEDLWAAPVCVPLIYEDRSGTIVRLRDNPKTLFCTFVGSPGTHPARARMIEALRGRPGVEIHTSAWTNRVSGPAADLFLDRTSRSVFTLCPRGHGPTSFRFYEAMALGSIPVYVWEDYPWLPYRDLVDYDRLCVSVHVDELGELYDRLRAVSPAQIDDMRAYARYFERLFTLEGTAEWIADVLRAEG